MKAGEVHEAEVLGFRALAQAKVLSFEMNPNEVELRGILLRV